MISEYNMLEQTLTIVPGLYVVATPLGNLNDISARALATLRSVNAIVAEDTRHSKRLLQHYLINTPMFSLHQHNEREKTDQIVEKIQAGQSIALITDAGTPTISDPGHILVHAAHMAGIPVIPIPGPSALIAALSASGFPASQFIFEGFLPAKPLARLHHLQTLMHETRTLVFYEAPHRIMAMLADLIACFGPDRPAVIARELTKLYETIQAGKLETLLTNLNLHTEQQCGEFVVVVHGASRVEQTAVDTEAERILAILVRDLPTKQAVALASEITNKSKNELYKHALELKSNK